jgi:uncharacterized protein involved in outer membrane biogenesis
VKKYLGALVVLVLLGLLGASWWAFDSRDDLLATAIRRYGPQITGVPVTLKGVHISPWDGVVTLTHLEVGSPAGFMMPHTLVVEKMHMRLDLASLGSEVVHIQEISVVQPQLSYEHASRGSNLDVIQRNIQAYVALHAGPASAPQGAPRPTRLILEQLSVQGARAQVSAAFLQGKTVSLSLPALHMQNIGKQAGGVTPAEAANEVVAAIRQDVGRAVMPLRLDSVSQSIKKQAASVMGAVKGFFK